MSRPGLVGATAVAAAVTALVSNGRGPPRLASVAVAPSPARVLTPRVDSPAAASSHDDRLHHYEYVFPDGAIDVYDADPGWRLVERIAVPDADGYRGVAVSPRRRMLFLSVGGNGGSSGHGALIAFDLMRNRVVWERRFPTGTDSLAVDPLGRRLYVPMGERSSGDEWYVVDARDGRVVDTIEGAAGPHNTIVSPDGRAVYLGPRHATFLLVGSTRTDRVVRRVGPLRGGVRPFTVDVQRQRAYTTATGFLGFQVGDLRTGRVLTTVPIHGFGRARPGGSPCHGISLSPDGRELDVIDVPRSFVHVFDVSQAPRLVANVALHHRMTGREHPCGGDCGKAGWLQHSLDGRFVYVGDSGDVIATRTHSVVGFLPALENSRYQLEIDWRGGVPTRTSTRSGIAYAR